MIGTIMVAIAVLLLLNYSGVKGGKALWGFGGVILAGGLTTLGFATHIGGTINAVTADSTWYTNGFIIAGAALMGIVVLATLYMVLSRWSGMFCNAVKVQAKLGPDQHA